MRRQQRRALLATGVALMLGIGVFAQVRHERAQWPEPLTTLPLSTIEHIDLQCPTCVHQRFARIDGVWWMHEPNKQLATSERIENLLGIAQASVRSRKSLTGLNLAKLGLEPAQATLTFNSTRIAIGAFDSIDGDRYVRIDDEDSIALVPDRFSPYLFAAPDSDSLEPRPDH